jgi:hypothetical protein
MSIELGFPKNFVAPKELNIWLDERHIALLRSYSILAPAAWAINIWPLCG